MNLLFHLLPVYQTGVIDFSIAQIYAFIGRLNMNTAAKLQSKLHRSFINWRF